MSLIPQNPRSGFPPPSVSTRVARQLSHLDMASSVRVAEVEATARVEAARVHAVGYVGQQALQAVALLSQMEGQLAALCPLATSRLQGLADMTALSIAQVVGDAARKVR